MEQLVENHALLVPKFVKTELQDLGNWSVISRNILGKIAKENLLHKVSLTGKVPGTHPLPHSLVAAITGK